ncbi:MAG: hypothetical protein M1831_005605 [Alyxoria varia]|nr:MAG: hypothetical protein M1831_005605 [Alyxoria varia]
MSSTHLQNTYHIEPRHLPKLHTLPTDQRRGQFRFGNSIHDSDLEGEDELRLPPLPQPLRQSSSDLEPVDPPILDRFTGTTMGGSKGFKRRVSSTMASDPINFHYVNGGYRGGSSRILRPMLRNTSGNLQATPGPVESSERSEEMDGANALMSLSLSSQERGSQSQQPADDEYWITPSEGSQHAQQLSSGSGAPSSEESAEARRLEAILEIRELPVKAFCRNFGGRCKSVDENKWPKCSTEGKLWDSDRNRHYEKFPFRLIISHYFGRNKIQSNEIKPCIEPICRPCYQREYYHHRRKKLLGTWHSNEIQNAIDRFIYSLTLPDLVQWEICGSDNKLVEKLQNPVEPARLYTGEDANKVNYTHQQSIQIQQVVDDFEGTGRSTQDVRDCLARLRNLCETYEINHLPFLQYLPKKGTSQ